MTKVMQVELRQEAERPRGTRMMVVWIDVELGLEPGCFVCGKEGELWEVSRIYPSNILDLTQVQKNWNVGGLG